MSISQEHTFRGKSFRGRGANKQYRDMSGGMHPNARYHNMSRGKGPNGQNHDMSGGMRPNGQNRGMSRGRRPNGRSKKGHVQVAEKSWIRWHQQNFSSRQFRRELEEDVNFNKIEHLFNKRKRVFQNESKLFGGLHFNNVISRVSGAYASQEQRQRGYSQNMSYREMKSYCTYVEGLVKENLPALTLKESITIAKVNIIRHVPSYILNKIENPAFPRKMLSRSLILKEEIKSLTGVFPTVIGKYLEDILSPMGRFILDARESEMFRDLHVKAAEFLIEHPEECPDYALGKL